MPFPDEPNWGQASVGDRNTAMTLLFNSFPPRLQPIIQQAIYSVMLSANLIAHTHADSQAAWIDWLSYIQANLGGATHQAQASTYPESPILPPVNLAFGSLVDDNGEPSDESNFLEDEEEEGLDGSNKSQEDGEDQESEEVAM